MFDLACMHRKFKESKYTRYGAHIDIKQPREHQHELPKTRSIAQPLDVRYLIISSVTHTRARTLTPLSHLIENTKKNYIPRNEESWQRRRNPNQAVGSSRQQVPSTTHRTRIFNTSVLSPVSSLSHLVRESTPVNVASSTSQMPVFTVGTRTTEVNKGYGELVRPQLQQQPQSKPPTCAELTRPQT
jgi:hypothetical protein